MFNSVLLAGPSYTVKGAILCALKSGFTDGNEWRWAMDDVLCASMYPVRLDGCCGTYRCMRGLAHPQC